MPIHPLLAITRTTGNPVIESEAVTFVWQGKTIPHLIDDLHNWEENPHIMKHAGNELWTYSLPIASDAYFEYAFPDPRLVNISSTRSTQTAYGMESVFTTTISTYRATDQLRISNASKEFQGEC
jgi:hypothetical protein